MEPISYGGYTESADPEQVHDGPMTYYSNPVTPLSDGGYKDGAMTQETIDMWSRGLAVGFEGGSDSVRPSPPSSSNGDYVNNPFRRY